MEQGEQDNLAAIEVAFLRNAVDLSNASSVGPYSPQGEVPQSADDRWLDNCHLTVKPLGTSGDLGGLGIPILRRATLDDAGHKHSRPIDSSRLEQLVQQKA
jgi:hypothetical protein